MTSSTHTHRTSPYSPDIRASLVSAVDNGMSHRAAARVFGVAPSTANNWVARRNETGSVERKPQGGDKRSHHLERYADEILALYREKSDITLHAMADWLEEEHGFKTSSVSIWRLLQRHGWSRKKKRSGPAS